MLKLRRDGFSVIHELAFETAAYNDRSADRERYVLCADVYIDVSLATVSISCGIGAAKKLEVPASDDTVTLNSEEEIMEWVSAMKFDEVTASLEKAGVDSKIMDVINQYTALLSMGM